MEAEDLHPFHQISLLLPLTEYPKEPAFSNCALMPWPTTMRMENQCSVPGHLGHPNLLPFFPSKVRVSFCLLINNEPELPSFSCLPEEFQSTTLGKLETSICWGFFFLITREMYALWCRNVEGNETLPKEKYGRGKEEMTWFKNEKDRIHLNRGK